MNGDGAADLAGVNSSDRIYYTLTHKTWTDIPGQLSQFRGRSQWGRKCRPCGHQQQRPIYYTLTLGPWTNIPGYLSQLVAGDLIPIRFQDETNHGTSVPWPDHAESTKYWLGKPVTPWRALRAWWRFGGHKRFSCLPSWGQPLSKPLRCLASPGLPCPDCRRDFGRACKPEHHHLVGEDAVGH